MLNAVVPDLSDPELYGHADLPGIWRGLRAERPVFWTDRKQGGFWSVLVHDKAMAVLRDPRTFISSKGMRLDSDPRAVAAAANKMLIVADPPRHTGIRRVVSSAFSARTAQRLRDNMRVTVTESLDRAMAEDECDFTKVAARLPVSVVCDLLGVPRQDWDHVLGLTMVAFGAAPGEVAAAEAEAHVQILMYFDDLLRQRRRRPQDDLVSVLAAAEVDGVPLTDEEIVLNCDGLLSGGNETTRHAMVGGVLALVENPGQWRRLRAGAVSMDSAVQEVLRYTSPAMHALRTATEDVEWAPDLTIRAGDKVAVWLPSANRDERVFPEPDEFLLDRAPNRALTFAHGPHHCLGSAFAVSEITIMLEEFVQRVEHAELRGTVTPLRSNLIWGFQHLPLRLS